MGQEKGGRDAPSVESPSKLPSATGGRTKECPMASLKQTVKRTQKYLYTAAAGVFAGSGGKGKKGGLAKEEAD